MLKRFIIALVFLASVKFCCATIHYVRPTADCTYSGDGTKWNCAASGGAAGAVLEVTGTLTRGDIYMLAGSANLYADFTRSEADSGTSTISIVKAVDCTIGSNNTLVWYCPGGTAPLYSAGTGPQTISGWSAGMGTTSGQWKDTWTDPQSHGSRHWNFCTDYFLVDGVVGNTDPITGPSGQGFQALGQGGIGVGCGAASQTNISILHSEIGSYGLSPFYRSSVSSCSYSGGVAVIGTSINTGGVSGDRYGGWTSSNAVLFTNKTASSASSSSVSIALSSSPCATLYAIALDFTPGGFVNIASGAETFTNITISYDYIHDAGILVGFENCSNCTLQGSYLARNRSTPTYHASCINITMPGGTVVTGPESFFQNFFLDCNGTAVITDLGQSTSPYGGIMSAEYVFSNIFTCSPTGIATLGNCQVSGSVTDTAGETALTNLYMFHNTFAFPSLFPYYGAGMYLNCGNNGRCAGTGTSSTGTAIDNLFYNVSNSGGDGVALKAQGGAATGFSNVQLYNSDVNSNPLDSLWTCTANSPNFDVCHGTGQADPFTNDAGYDYHPTTAFTAANNANTQWATGNCSLSSPFNAPPYDLDFYGVVFGSTTGCARGAVEFGGSPPPPGAVSLSTRTIAFGTVITGTQNDGVGTDPSPLILTNIGGGTLTISSITPPTGFTESDTCGASLVSLAYCTITVTVGAGSHSGNLVLTTSATTSPDDVALSAIGVATFIVPTSGGSFN
jgi:hypothetical protein